MDEPTTTPDASAAEAQLETPGRLQMFVNNHPRAAKVAAAIGTAGTVVGGVLFVKTLQSNKDHLDAAADHVKGAATELSASVNPSGDTEA